jgi:hypothetical protein
MRGCVHDLLQQSSFTRTLNTGSVLELTQADTMLYTACGTALCLHP